MSILCNSKCNMKCILIIVILLSIAFSEANVLKIRKRDYIKERETSTEEPKESPISLQSEYSYDTDDYDTEYQTQDTTPLEKDTMQHRTESAIFAVNVSQVEKRKNICKKKDVDINTTMRIKNRTKPLSRPKLKETKQKRVSRLSKYTNRKGLTDSVQQVDDKYISREVNALQTLLNMIQHMEDDLRNDKPSHDDDDVISLTVHSIPAHSSHNDLRMSLRHESLNQPAHSSLKRMGERKDESFPVIGSRVIPTHNDLMMLRLKNLNQSTNRLIPRSAVDGKGSHNFSTVNNYTHRNNTPERVNQSKTSNYLHSDMNFNNTVNQNSSAQNDFTTWSLSDKTARNQTNSSHHDNVFPLNVNKTANGMSEFLEDAEYHTSVIEFEPMELVIKRSFNELAVRPENSVTVPHLPGPGNTTQSSFRNACREHPIAIVSVLFAVFLLVLALIFYLICKKKGYLSIASSSSCDSDSESSHREDVVSKQCPPRNEYLPYMGEEDDQKEKNVDAESSKTIKTLGGYTLINTKESIGDVLNYTEDSVDAEAKRGDYPLSNPSGSLTQVLQGTSYLKRSSAVRWFQGSSTVPSTESERIKKVKRRKKPRKSMAAILGKSVSFDDGSEDSDRPLTSEEEFENMVARGANLIPAVRPVTGTEQNLKQVLKTDVKGVDEMLTDGNWENALYKAGGRVVLSSEETPEVPSVISMKYYLGSSGDLCEKNPLLQKPY